MKRVIIALLIIGVVGAGAGAYYKLNGKRDVQVQTSALTRGDIIDSVSATGTLQAVTTVQVGSQVSGNIAWLGADFNSIVKKGQVIAKLDPSLIDAQLQQSRANLASQRANLQRAESELERTRVQLADAQQKYARAKELAARNLLPLSELDASKTTVDAAQASLVSQQASVLQAKAGVTQSEASVNQTQVNLNHTVIEAPIDGIITQRSVDVGQTVAASMSAPTLFMIAADLTKMQVNANIDEADVGRIRPGQHVTFRVDAYPTDSFTGTVVQIRLQPIVVQNVTTYGTVIDVPNSELKLKPGMTANVRIEIAKRTDALRIPNMALRFRPTNEVFEALNQPIPAEAQFPTGGSRAGRGGGGGGQGRGGQTPGAPGAGQPNAGQPSGAPSAPAVAQPAPNASESGAQVGFRGGASTPPGSGQAGGRGGAEQGGRDRGRDGSGRGGGGRGGFGGGGGGGRGNFDPARMMDRFKGMSEDEQKQFVERMRGRGADVSAFEKEMKKPASAVKPKYGNAPTAATIDALFAPIPVVESRGRAWLYNAGTKELKPINLRLGISDGTNTEVLSSEIPQGTEVVTGVTGLGSTRPQPGQGNQGNPLMPGGGRGPGNFGGGGNPGRGR